VFELNLPPLDASVSVARHAVAGMLGGQCLEFREMAVFLISELVTNAVTHAKTPLRLGVVDLGDAMRFEVFDESPSLPLPREAGPEDEHGRGLFLVSSLSRSWGCEARLQGKLVWFELGKPPLGSEET
jgi:hypothetical protein